MARVCRRQQCSVEKRGFRQELDSWRHKLIHCVGETLRRPPPPLRPLRRRPPWTREEAGELAIAAPARPPSLARASPPPPPPGVRARATSRRAPPFGRARAGPSPPRASPGRALGGARVPPPPALHPRPLAPLRPRSRPCSRSCYRSGPGAPAPPPAYCGDSPRGTAAVVGVAGGARLCSAPTRAPAAAVLLPRHPSPTRGARPQPCVHARRTAGGRPALGRVRSVRWRWGRRELELSQSPGAPDRAKWGVMAAGGSGCTSSAGGGGRGVNPRRTGRCVRICVRCRAAGRRE